MVPNTDAGPAHLVRTFDLGELCAARRVARGAMGAVWRIEAQTTMSVTSYAAKELFWEIPQPDEVEDEILFTDQCRRAGIPSPRSLATPAGEYLVRDPSGRSWRLYEWVDGQVPDRTDVETASWLARQLGRIHALAVTPRQTATPHGFYHHVNVDWGDLLRDATTADVSLTPQLEAALDRLLALSALVNAAPAGNQVICHRDPKNSNVLRESSGQRWLIDWDNCGPMAPTRELGLALMHHLTDLDALAAIATSYRDQGGTARLTDAQGFATGLAVWLNFLHGQARVLLDPNAAPGDRQFAEPRVTGLLRNIPSIEQLELAAQAAG